MDTLKKLEAGRAALIYSAPFFGMLAAGLRVELCTTIETADIDMVTLRANPDWVEGLTGPQVTGMWAHEVMHCAGKHHQRRQGRDHKKWNRACDYEINPMIRDAKLTLPAGALLSAQYAGKSAEEIYSLLPDEAGDDQQQGGKPKAGQQGQPGAQGAQGAQGQPDQQPDQQQGQQPGQPGQKGNPADQPGADPGKCGGMREPPSQSGQGPASQADMSQHAQNWEVKATQAATMAANAGNMPGSITKLIEELKRPKLDWAAIMRRFFANAQPSDYAWTAPNRRYLSQGLFLPSLRPDRLGDIAVFVDTSASVTDAQLAEFSGELSGICADAMPERVHVVYCDRKIGGTRTYEHGDVIKLEAVGRGGTDLRPPFAHIEREGVQPVCAVYLTDLDVTPDLFPVDPGYPVLWVSNGKSKAPFGEVVMLPKW